MSRDGDDGIQVVATIYSRGEWPLKVARIEPHHADEVWTVDAWLYEPLMLTDGGLEGLHMALSIGRYPNRERAHRFRAIPCVDRNSIGDRHLLYADTFRCEVDFDALSLRDPDPIAMAKLGMAACVVLTERVGELIRTAMEVCPR